MDYQLAQEKGEQIKIEAPVEQPEQTEVAETVELEGAEQVNPVKEPSEAQITPDLQPSETQEQRNFRTLRKNKEKAERERDDALRRLQAYENDFRRPTGNQYAAPQEDDEVNIGKDEIVEGKHLHKQAASVDKRIKNLEQQLRDQINRNSLVTTEIKLRSEMPDFDKVVSEENIELLKDQHPEYAYVLESTPDMYAKAKVAYKAIKSMGIYKEDNFMKERAKAQINAAKPRPVVSIAPQTGDTPLSRANAFDQGLTDELRIQLIKEMEQARRGI